MAFDEKLRLNNNVDEKCYLEDGKILVRDTVWTFYKTVDGFPVRTESSDGPYCLVPEIFNHFPKKWEPDSDDHFERSILDRFFRSMGFTNVRWYSNDKERSARMQRGKNYFEFTYTP